MSEMRNCKQCGQLFNYLGFIDVCDECKKKDDEDYEKICDALQKKGNLTILEAVSELKINLRRIQRFLKDGKVSIKENEKNMILFCEKCNKPISSGRLCFNCSSGNDRIKDVKKSSGFDSIEDIISEKEKQKKKNINQGRQ